MELQRSIVTLDRLDTVFNLTKHLFVQLPTPHSPLPTEFEQILLTVQLSS
jgi:hypothetical protein